MDDASQCELAFVGDGPAPARCILVSDVTENDLNSVVGEEIVKVRAHPLLGTTSPVENHAPGALVVQGFSHPETESAHTSRDKVRTVGTGDPSIYRLRGRNPDARRHERSVTGQS